MSSQRKSREIYRGEKREGEKKSGRGEENPVDEGEGGAKPLLLSSSRLKTDGRMFWPTRGANRSQGAAPYIRAALVWGSVWLNLKSVFTGSLLLLSARFFSLMVVQTLKTMKIQESPVTCDAGRVGGEVRGPDSDCEKTSCEDVPRLDLTALTEDNNWGGEPGDHLAVA